MSNDNLPVPNDVPNQSLIFPPPKLSRSAVTQINPKSRVSLKAEAQFDESNLSGVNDSAPFYATAPPLLPIQTKLDTGKEDRSIGGGWKGDNKNKRKRVRFNEDRSRYGKSNRNSLKGWYGSEEEQRAHWRPVSIIVPQEELVRHRWSNTPIFAMEIGNSLVWDPRQRTNRDPITAEEPITRGDGYDSFWIEIGYGVAGATVVILSIFALMALLDIFSSSG